jgi:hypothetical protein
MYWNVHSSVHNSGNNTSTRVDNELQPVYTVEIVIATRMTNILLYPTRGQSHEQILSKSSHLQQYTLEDSVYMKLKNRPIEFMV